VFDRIGQDRNKALYSNRTRRGSGVLHEMKKEEEEESSSNVALDKSPYGVDVLV
jgi:hypothetical protein